MRTSTYSRHTCMCCIKGLEPAKDQQQLPAILDAVGNKILDLTQNFPNTISQEADPSGEAEQQGETTGLAGSIVPCYSRSASAVPRLGACLQGIPRQSGRE